MEKTSFKAPAPLVAEVKKHTKSLKYFKIPFLPASDENLNGYGRLMKLSTSAPIQILQWPPPGRRGVMGGTDVGAELNEIEIRWDDGSCFFKRLSDEDTGAKGRLIAIREEKKLLIQDVFCNLNSEKLFLPIEKVPYAMILSKSLDDETVSPLDFVGFFFDGSMGVMLHPGVWHQSPFTEETSRFLCKEPQVPEVIRLDFSLDFDIFVALKNPFVVPTKTKEFKELSQNSSSGKNPEEVLPNQWKENVAPSGKLGRKLILETAVPENIEPYGVLLQDNLPPNNQISILTWPGTKRTVHHGQWPRITTSRFSVEWDHMADNTPNDLILFKNGRWISGGCTFSNALYHVDKLYAQIDGSYVVFPLETASYIMILAGKDGNGEPERWSLKAFLIFPEQGLLLNPGVWHSQPIPSNKCKELPFLEKHNAVNARMELCLIEECKKLISIQLNDEQNQF